MDILKPHFKLFLRPGLTSLTKVPQKWLRIYATCSPSPKVELRNKDPSFECAELILLGNIGNIRRIKTLDNKNIIAGFCC